MKRIKVLKAYFITWLFILYIVYANAELLGTFFMATVIFSTAIVGLLAVGTLYQIVSGFDIMMLGGTFGALAYKKTGYEFYLRSIDSLLPANIAHMLQSRKSQQKMLFTQEESRNIVDWLEDKFHKQKSYINFFINTAMLVGLLGTFVGLVEAIDHMGQIILSLDGDVDIKQIMQDFSGPLSGMAIGFGASLFGVVAAVIMGLNGYILFRYQDTLISGIEDWLKDRIIDIAPENMGGSSVSASNTALPEQRKSFMDIFIEQMSNFTDEIAKFSKSNESLHVMASSLASIKSVMESQKETLSGMAELQERHYGKFDSFSNGLSDSYEVTNKRLTEDRAILQDIFENHGRLLEQSGTTLSSVDTGIANIGRRLESHQSVLGSLVSINEKGYQEKERMHIEFLGAIDTVGSAIKHETQTMSEFASEQDAKTEKISHILSSALAKISDMDTKMDKSGEALFGIASLQKAQFDESAKAYALMQENMTHLNDSIKNEIRVFEGFAETQNDENKKIVQNQAQAIELFRTISASLDKARQTLSSVADTQNAIKQESGQSSAELLNAVTSVNRSLQTNRTSLEAILGAQESFDAKYSKLQNETLGTLRSISDTSLSEKTIASDILKTSQAINDGQKVASEESLKAFDTLGSELSKIEKLTATYSEERRAFEEAYFRNSTEKQNAIIEKLELKVENTQVSLETIAQSLKNIEEVMARLDANGIINNGSASSEGKKGFLSSLFGKN